MEIKIRKMDPSEYELLSDFLYEAIFQRDENNLLPREIIQEPTLRIYIEDFGEKKHDHCLCAVADDVIVGAVWTRIIKGYGSVDDSIPEFAVSIRRGFRGKGIGTALMEQMIELLKRLLWLYRKTIMQLECIKRQVFQSLMKMRKSTL